MHMIYLDNAATGGEKTAAVQGAVLAAMKACANPGRSGHKRSIALAERVLACRKLLAELFGGSFERVVFTKNCTEALNIAILGTLRAGDHAVVSCLEHNAVLRPLEHAKKTMGVTYSVVPLVDGKLLPDTVASLVRPETRLCCITSASNVTGLAPDLDAIRLRLPERVLFAVDGAQGAGHLPLHMRETGIDFLALAGHKGMQAIQGAGALLFSERACPDPVLFGGTGSESLNLNMPAFYPDALEAGTLNYPAVISMGEGALYLKTRLYEHRDRLVYFTDMLLEGLSKMPFVKVYSGTNPYGIVAFEVCGKSSEAVADVLSRDYSVCVRAGYHCAPLMHAALGTSGLVRASLSAFNTENEVEYFLRALAQTAGQVG